jgi:hypothetical protein
LRNWLAPLPVAWHTIGLADRVPGILARHIVDACACGYLTCLRTLRWP